MNTTLIYIIGFVVSYPIVRIAMMLLISRQYRSVPEDVFDTACGAFFALFWPISVPLLFVAVTLRSFDKLLERLFK